MRVALGQHPVATHEYLTFAKQLGVGGVQLNMIGKEIDLIGEVTDLPPDKGYPRCELFATAQAEGQ